MEKKFTEGEWVIDKQRDTVRIDILCNNEVVATCWDDYDCVDQLRANAKLIAAAPNMLDALLETDKDLCVLESTMSQIESTDPRAEGMTELVKKWRERNKLAINKATE